jgi:dipeptidase D
MTKITDLQPKIVWKYFDDILKIPRPSKKEEKIIAYLEDFAKSNKLEYKKDKAGNMLIIKEATPGKENVGAVVLQSHVDMVCEKNSDIEHDFDNDPIEAYIDGEWLKAKGTTLGADNGIGIAAQLAVLSDTTIAHGKIECLFTVDEETGLTGAFNLSQGFFEGKTLINLDSEDDGEVFIGCAGGIDTLITYPLSKVDVDPSNKVAIKVSLAGLKGGHSGDDIDKGFGNSNLLLTRFLWNVSKKFKAQIADFQGGNLRNAIPREAFTVFVIDSNKKNELNTYLSEFEKVIKNEYAITEPGLSITQEEVSLPKQALEATNQDKLLCSVYSCPNGVITMSQSVKGLVETSTNLASIHFMEDNTAEIVTSQRSSVESSKLDLADKIRSNFYLAGAKVHYSDPYPGWEPNTNSQVLKIAVSAYKDLFNQDVTVRAIHAGLECGLFLEKYPELDMVSIGPTLRGVHSPDERMEIHTVEKFWKHLVEILKRMP